MAFGSANQYLPPDPNPTEGLGDGIIFDPYGGQGYASLGQVGGAQGAGTDLAQAGNANAASSGINFGGQGAEYANSLATMYGQSAQAFQNRAAPIDQGDYANSAAALSQQGQTVAQQQANASYLQQVANGTAGPSAAQSQLQAGIQQSQRAQMAAANSARGGGNSFAAAQRTAAQQAAQQQQGGANSAATLKAQEMQAGESAYQNQLQQMSQGQLTAAGQYAANAGQMTNSNMGWAQQQNQYNQAMWGMGMQAQQSQLNAELAEKGYATQQSLQSQQIAANQQSQGIGASTAAAGALMGLAVLSDERRKRDVYELGVRHGRETAASLADRYEEGRRGGLSDDQRDRYESGLSPAPIRYGPQPVVSSEWFRPVQRYDMNGRPLDSMSEQSLAADEADPRELETDAEIALRKRAAWTDVARAVGLPAPGRPPQPSSLADAAPGEADPYAAYDPGTDPGSGPPPRVVVASDERSKTKTEEPPRGEVSRFLSEIRPVSFDYKDPRDGQGRQYGVMAQDLQRTPMGASMVENTTRGLVVDTRKAATGSLAALAEHEDRLRRLEAAHG